MNGVVIKGSFLVVHVELQPFTHLVLEDIIPPTSFLTRCNIAPRSTMHTIKSPSQMTYSATFAQQTLPEQETQSSNKLQKAISLDNVKLSPCFSWGFVWKKCLITVDKDKKYFVDKKNSRVVTKINGYGDSMILGNMALPLNKVISWNIKILKSKNSNGYGIYIGVAPFDIDQNEDNSNSKCGWYFNCYCSSLCSGPPHNYRGKEYGPRKGKGEYIHTGDSVGVVMNTTKGELSFVVNGVNLGVAFDGIPLDKPLMPCVILGNEGDSVKVKKKRHVNVLPSNITAKSITWDSITLSWNAVEGASSYQIEVDGSKFLGASTTRTFTERDLQPDTEHSFRVRAVWK